MNRRFERAERARRRKAALISAVITTSFFYLLFFLSGSPDLSEYLPDFLKPDAPQTEKPAQDQPVAASAVARP